MPSCYNFGKFKFGFEYEVLVQVKYTNFIEMLRREYRKNPSDDPFISFIQNNLKNRIKLANLYKKPFEVVQYKGVFLDYFNEFKKIFREKQSWIITQDPSVTANDGFIPFYNKFIDRFNLENKKQENKDIINNIEIVSPILTWEQINDDILENMLGQNLLKPEINQYLNNATTSNHVHISYDKLFQRAEITVKMLMAWWYFEPVFLYLVGYWRRDNEYCSTIYANLKETGVEDSIIDNLFFTLNETTLKAKLAEIFPEISEGILGLLALFQGENRYVTFNMLNIFSYGTIEIRLKHGSADMTENKMYIMLLTYFFKAAMEKQCVTTLYGEEEKDLFLKTNKDVYNLTKGLVAPVSSTPKSNLPNLFDKLFNFMNTPEYADSQFTSRMFPFLNKSKKKENEPQLYEYWQNIFKLNLDESIPNNEYNNGNIAGGSIAKYLFSFTTYNIPNISRHLKKTPAHLQNYTRIFAGHSSKWQGALPSIIKAKGHRVHGTLIEMTSIELDKLDAFQTGYTRHTIKVVNHENNQTVNAYVYIKNSTEFKAMPSQAYMLAIYQHHNKPIVIRGIINNEMINLGEWSKDKGFQKTR